MSFIQYDNGIPTERFAVTQLYDLAGMGYSWLWLVWARFASSRLPLLLFSLGRFYERLKCKKPSENVKIEEDSSPPAFGYHFFGW